MAQDSEKTLQTFETRFHQLLLAFEEQKKEKSQLQADLSQKASELEAVQQALKSLKADYANLKLAKMIEIKDDELHDAKSRISKLVREIDKCIALLNV